MPDPAILVTGAHRSGTTWVGKMLAAGPQTAYISEPLNVLHRPGVLRIPIRHWYTYICADNEDAYLPAFCDLLALRYGLRRELAALRSARDAGRMLRDARIFAQGRITGARPLLKDPFAVFSTRWFSERLGCRIVITVRHPAAFASSLKRLGWPFDFNDLLAQPLLMRDWLEPLRPEIESAARRPEDVIGGAVLLWSVVYGAVDALHKLHPEYILVRHEDLSLDPANGYHALYDRLGLTYTPNTEQVILNSSSSDNPGELSKRAVHTVRLDSQANLHNWKHRLEAEEIRRIRRMTEELASEFYPEIDWE